MQYGVAEIGHHCHQAIIWNNISLPELELGSCIEKSIRKIVLKMATAKVWHSHPGVNELLYLHQMEGDYENNCGNDDGIRWKYTWRRYGMVLREGNAPVTSDSPHKGPVMQSFYKAFDVT